MNEEEALVRAFVIKPKQARLIELLANPKRRRDVTAALAHFRDLDPRFRLPSDSQDSESIVRALRLRGAGDTCHVISEHGALDGQRLPLASALDQIVGFGMGTLLSCIPGTLGYFEDEEDRCVVARPAS
jgi:hypothetical protein